jgi:hypothetical protein
MDYAKSGNAAAAKAAPRSKRAGLKGAPKADDKAAEKAALLARMKAAAAAKPPKA